DAMARQQERARLATQGGQLTLQTLSPLEAADRVMARLRRLRETGNISEEVFNRATGDLARGLINQAGDVPVGAAALTEGSAAAVSAINRAIRQAERANPNAEVERALRELNERQDRIEQVNRELSQALRSGRVFRRADI